MNGQAVISARQLALLAGVSVDRRAIRFEHDERILRAMSGDAAALFASLLRSPSLDRLFDAGLVRFRESEFLVEGAELVLEVERQEVVSYPQEWPTAMLHEAGLATARLGATLAFEGLGLLDAHPWNILFAGSRATWVDLGSIAPVQRISSSWVAEFRRHVVLPLALRRLGWQTMADAVWRDHPGDGVKALWERRPIPTLFPMGYARATRQRAPAAFFENLERYLLGMRVEPRRGEWSGYGQAGGVAVGDTERYDPKQRAVDTYLGDLAPGLVIDVGANAGWYSELAVRHGNRVIAVDMDDVTLSQLFRRAQAQALPIQPLRLNVMWPTGSHGLGLALSAAPDRLRADTSLWLAVVHHLVGRQHLSFATVARAIDQFTKHAAIVEFIPREDVHVRTWQVADEPWYDADHFIAAMAPYFPRVDILPSSPEPRVMLCFRRA